MLTFRDSKKSFKLDGDLLKTITNCNFNVTHSNPQGQKLIYEFVKEMNFNINWIGRKSNRDEFLAKLLKSPSIMVSSSGVSCLTRRNFSQTRDFYIPNLMNFVID